MKWYSKSFSYGMELAEFLNKKKVNLIADKKCNLIEKVEEYKKELYLKDD